MATVAQLIAYLQTQPQDAIVHVGYEKTQSWATHMAQAPVDLDITTVVGRTDDSGRIVQTNLYLQAE
jgi:sulfur carrier protein ThiS